MKISYKRLASSSDYLNINAFHLLLIKALLIIYLAIMAREL